MSGNASEEAVLTKLDHPGHMDASRFAGLSGSLVAVLVAMLTVNGIGVIWGIILGGLVGLVVGGMVYRWINRRQINRQAAEMQAARERDEAEAEAQIAAMRART